MSQNGNLITLPSEADLQILRDQISEAKRIAEYAQLKRDLQKIITETVNTPNEFDGMMQVPDMQQMLKAKREKPRFIDLFIDRLRGMFSVRPIMGNIIALLIAFIALYYIYDELGISRATKDFLAIGIEIFSAIQVIKSGTRGLLLPFLALIIGGVGAHILSHSPMLFHFGHTFYEQLMVVGIIGLGISVLSID